MALITAYIINVRIFFLFIHHFRFVYHFYNDVEFIPKLFVERIATFVANHINNTTNVEFQLHKTTVPLQTELYIGLTVTEILLPVKCKELIFNPVFVYMNTRL